MISIARTQHIIHARKNGFIGADVYRSKKEGPVKEAFQLVVLLVQALVYIALLMWPPTEGGHQ